MFIDTHAHLYFERFDDDREQVIRNAFMAGITGIINIAIDLETSGRCLELAEQYEGLWATVGVHPNDAWKYQSKSAAEIRLFAQHDKVVAIGEIGLDFYRDSSPRDIQRKVFHEQLALADELQMPIVIHNRDAGRDILEVIKTSGLKELSGVFHCFSEDLSLAEEILELGFHISFTGNLTFKNSLLPDIARAVPIDRLLLETDCPFLAPQPRRGRRNEPANVVYIAEKLAEIKGTTVGAIAAATTANAKLLFGI